jgi:uncharacterized OB-fold protein
MEDANVEQSAGSMLLDGRADVGVAQQASILPLDRSAYTMPEPDSLTAGFWSGGGQGLLMIQRCPECEHLQHPPLPRCERCQSIESSPVPTPMSGRGTVHGFTVNQHPWTPQLVVPYVVAEVELDEEEQLIILSNIVQCDPDEVQIGLRVEVCFASVADDIFIPLFRPLAHEVKR